MMQRKSIKINEDYDRWDWGYPNGHIYDLWVDASINGAKIAVSEISENSNIDFMYDNDDDRKIVFDENGPIMKFSFFDGHSSFSFSFEDDLFYFLLLPGEEKQSEYIKMAKYLRNLADRIEASSHP